MGVSDKPSRRLGFFSVGGTTMTSSMLVLVIAQVTIASATPTPSSSYPRLTQETLLPVAAAAVSQSLAAGTEPSWLLGWQQLQQQRMDRLDSVLKVRATQKHTVY